MSYIDNGALPETIEELLRSLIGERTTIIFESGKFLKNVRIITVVGELVVVDFFRCGVIFIRISCICAVKAECTDILENILRDSDY